MPTVGEEQKKPPILELGDVRLRPLRTSDAPALLAYLSDPGAIEHTSIPIATPESVAAAVARDMAAYREVSSFRLALASSDDRLIGICGFNTWSSVHRHAELAYELAPDYWARGYMHAAVLALLRWGFSDLSLNRVHAFVMTNNARSIRLVKLCGFTTHDQYGASSAAASPARARCGNTASPAGCRRTSTSSRFSLKTSPSTKWARRLTRRYSEPRHTLRSTS